MIKEIKEENEIEEISEKKDKEDKKNIKEKKGKKEKEIKNNDEKPTKNTRLTHFIHFPFYSSKEFIEKAEEFIKKVLEIDDNYLEFTYNKKYHLTIICLSLDNEDQINEIKAIMEKIKTILHYTKNNTCTLNCKGINIFKPFNQNEDIEKKFITPANVLFAEPDINCEEFILIENIIDFIIRELIENDLYVRKEFETFICDEDSKKYKVKQTHITLLAGKKNKKGKRPVIEAEPILEKMRDFDFKFIKFDELVFSKMDRYYTPIFSVKI